VQPIATTEWALVLALVSVEDRPQGGRVGIEEFPCALLREHVLPDRGVFSGE